MKFSIIVPVYNVEEYILKCLESINKQSYDNYEVIIVNDGSPDNSEKIIKKYIKNNKKFKYYKKDNGGLSDARNYGIQFTTGDYLLFVDSDDYIDEKLLQKINDIVIKNQYDLVKFNFVDVIDNKEYPHIEKLTKSKKVDIKEIIYFDYFEPACSYCYNLNFYKTHSYKFEKGKYHEDFGLLPLILLDSKSIYYLNYFGYYYVKRENSITNDTKKAYQKAEDVLYFSLSAFEKIKLNKNNNEDNRLLIMSFYANAVLGKLKSLGKSKKYLKQVKKHKIYKYLPSNTLKQKIKKIICKLNYNMYIDLFK